MDIDRELLKLQKAARKELRTGSPFFDGLTGLLVDLAATGIRKKIPAALEGAAPVETITMRVNGKPVAATVTRPKKRGA